MTRLLHVDDAVNGLSIVDAIRDSLGWEVVTVEKPDGLCEVLAAQPAFDLAMIDLAFSQSTCNGLDALLAVHQHTPTCRLVAYTGGDWPFAKLLRDAWEALPLATALAKTTPNAHVLDSLVEVATNGSAPVDPFLRPRLPSSRSEWRSFEKYDYLVPHAGHAKLWQALIDLDDEPSYDELARATQLKLNTVRNYRSELLERLKLHNLDQPRVREMQQFAKRCRALLEPHIRNKLPAGDHAPSPCGS
ncbi:MAG: hypothetical protein ACRD2C_25265 [Acidimicrobiales bacterium]